MYVYIYLLKGIQYLLSKIEMAVVTSHSDNVIIKNLWGVVEIFELRKNIQVFEQSINKKLDVRQEGNDGIGKSSSFENINRLAPMYKILTKAI